MKKILYFLVVLLFLFAFNEVNAQLSGPKSIPGDYPTITLAVVDLNIQGIGPGGVTFNVAAGYTETILAPIAITATGTCRERNCFPKKRCGSQSSYNHICRD